MFIYVGPARETPMCKPGGQRGAESHPRVVHRPDLGKGSLAISAET